MNLDRFIFNTKVRGGRGVGGIAIAANPLDDLLIKAALAPTYERQLWILKIREYIRTSTVEKLSKEISVITSPVELRILTAAGVPAGAQTVLIEQIAKVSKR